MDRLNWPEPRASATPAVLLGLVLLACCDKLQPQPTVFAATSGVAMEKFNTSRVYRNGRYVALLVLTSLLSACGGSGGDTTTDNADSDNNPSVTESIINPDNLDFDRDGMLNVSDTDADGDGLIDDFDPFVDLDGDGRDDDSGMTQAQAEDTQDAANSDCAEESGAVAFGQTPGWNSNCAIRRSSVGGAFADSLYSVGVQRIVFCSGFGEAANDDYRRFADGEYGPNSENALQQFQASSPNTLTDDGIVGPDTWAKLKNALTLLQFGELDENSGEVSPDIYGFVDGRCGGTPLLFQDLTYDATIDKYILGGWRLAQNSPSVDEADALPFSIGQPFGLLESSDAE